MLISVRIISGYFYCPSSTKSSSPVNLWWITTFSSDYFFKYLKARARGGSRQRVETTAVIEVIFITDTPRIVDKLQARPIFSLVAYTDWSCTAYRVAWIIYGMEIGHGECVLNASVRRQRTPCCFCEANLVKKAKDSSADIASAICGAALLERNCWYFLFCIMFPVFQVAGSVVSRLCSRSCWLLRFAFFVFSPSLIIFIRDALVVRQGRTLIKQFGKASRLEGFVDVLAECQSPRLVVWYDAHFSHISTCACGNKNIFCTPLYPSCREGTKQSRKEFGENFSNLWYVPSLYDAANQFDIFQSHDGKGGLRSSQLYIIALTTVASASPPITDTA